MREYYFPIVLYHTLSSCARYKLHKNRVQDLLVVYIEIVRTICYNINRTKGSEVKKMPPFPNEYEPDNTDTKELTEYAAQLLDEINERK